MSSDVPISFTEDDRAIVAEIFDKLDASEVLALSVLLDAYDAQRRDAARYRWLRAHPVFQIKELPNELELLDACIDRYMAGRETEG